MRSGYVYEKRCEKPRSMWKQRNTGCGAPELG